MSVLDLIEIVEGDITQYPSDLMILKFADGNYGADLAVADAIGFRDHVPAGEYLTLPGEGTGANEVVFIGVGPLFNFRYDAIRDFGRRLAITAAKVPTAKTITTTIHGPGYGLDEVEALRSEILGLVDAKGLDVPEHLERIVFVERSGSRVKRLQKELAWLKVYLKANPAATRETAMAHSVQYHLRETLSGAEHWETPHPVPPTGPQTSAASPDEKPKLFVAMPYDDIYDDEYYIGFEEAARPLGFLLEHLKNEFYTGDIVDEIRKRIENSVGMIALLNGKNPNVFLEIGYAMALDKPIIFVAEEGMEVPFDIRNMRRITYSSIRDLRKSMGEALKALSDEN